MLHGIAILACFSPARPTLDLEEIAGEINVSATDTREHASALVTLGYLEQQADERERYRLAKQLPKHWILSCA